MSKSKPIITHCTVNDGAEVSRINMCAFWEDENWLEELIAINTDRSPLIFLRDRNTVRHLKAVDAETGRLVGYARWRLPEGCCKGADGSAFWVEGQVPRATGEEFDRIWDTADKAKLRWDPVCPSDEDDPDTVVAARKEELLEAKEYVVLEYLAIHPEHQRKGVGLALIKHGLERVRELGLDCFVLALQGGFRLYQKAGFTVLDSIVQDATKVGGNDHYEVRSMERKWTNRDDVIGLDIELKF